MAAANIVYMQHYTDIFEVLVLELALNLPIRGHLKSIFSAT